jgi:hypothetical protein
MESRQLLSAGLPHHHGAANLEVPAHISLHPRLFDRATTHHRATTDLAMNVALSGSVQGTDAFQGSEIVLNGFGDVGPLGSVTSRGFLTASGAEPVSYNGTVTLFGSTGSVTLNLVGQQFGANHQDQPVRLTYTITGGTGAFGGASGSGQASLTTGVPGASPSFVLTFGVSAGVPA